MRKLFGKGKNGESLDIVEKGEKGGFWKKVEKASDWMEDKIQNLSDKIDYEQCERIINLYKVLIWPVLILWILAALTRIILLFVSI